MTSFTRTDIPASITTVEQLGVWVLTVLSSINTETSVEEVKGQLSYVSTSASFFLPDAPAGERFRHIGRLSIKLNKDYRTEEKKIWEYALEFSTATIPSSMKT
jgi:hypothetical protein